MRIRGATTELQEAGLETEGMAESTAKMRQEIMALSGVDIMLNENTFKSTYQIMDELSKKWESLSDIAQASIIELMAGKHQGNVFASLMSNFDTAREALEVSVNSAGSALKEHERASQSLEFKLNALRSTWQSLAQSFMKSDFLKSALDGVIALVDGIDGLINTFGTLPTLLTAFTAFKSISGGGFFKTLKDEATGAATGITNAFKEASIQTKRTFENIGLKTDSSFKASIDADIDALYRLKKSIDLGATIDDDAFGKIFENASESAKEFAKSGKLATDGIDGFVNSQKEAQVSTLAQNKSLSSAKAIINEYYGGCKNVEMGQQSFASAVGKTNPQLAKQLATAKSAKGAFAGYIASMVGAKAATIALEAATMAMNMAITMGISALISWGIQKLDEWIETADELAERIGEITTEYEEQHNTMMKIKGDYDTSNEDSLISKYGKLSKGVNSLGENISLTADEYEEYQSIVNTIAGQMPSLVTGYNSQGQAILECAGSVDKLSESYKNLIKEQNDEVLDIGSDIFKDFKNDLKETSAYFQETITDENGLTEYIDHYNTNHIDDLEKLMNLNGDELEKAVSNLSYNEYTRISELLGEQGLERNVLGSGDAGFETQKEHIIRAITEDKAKIKGILEDASADLNAYAEDLGTVTEAYFSTAFLGGDDSSIGDYSHFSDKMQGIITQITSSFDSDFYTQFLDDENPYESLTKYFDSMLSTFDSMGSGNKAKLEAAFDLQTQFNGGEVSYGEYVKGVQDAGKLIDSLGLADEVSSELKLALNIKEVTEDYEALKKRLTSDEYNIKMNASEAEEFLNGLSASEYAVAVDLMVNGDVDLSNFNIDSLKKYIEEQAKLNEAMNFTITIDAEVEGVEAFNTAISESVSATGLSSESISALKSRYAELAEQGYDLSSMFEETSNGIHLNRNAVNELEQTLASNKLSETEGHLDTLKGRYDELTEEIDNCTDAGERANLYSEQQQVAQKINDLATLASQYEGLTSAYNEWQNAESAGNERDMYENIISGFETVEDELSRGWVDDGTIKFLELMSGKTDLVGKSAKELKQVYKDLDKEIKNTGYSVKDFFTVDDEGNSTSKGVYNFLKAVETLEKDKKFKDKDGISKLVQRDDDGNIISFDFQVAGGDKAIADALGISEELVQIMKRAADDAGFVVTIDGKWTQLADLKTSAEESENALKKLKTNGLDALKDFDDKDLDFNFDANSLESLNGELEKALNVLDKFRNKDGTVNMKMEGAEEALEIASYFTATIDKLTEPVYMQLETNQVEENLQEPLTKMQEFERLSKEKHQLKLTGDTKGLKDVEAEMDEIAKYLDNLDEETKIDLDIDGLTQEEIKDKLEKGEIEIPATVDIQLEMSEDIKDMRLLMMNQLGLASDNEIKLKIGYEIDDSLVDKLTDEEKEVVIKYIEENEDAWNKLSEEDKEIFIELVASGVDLETLTDDETKEVVIDFVTKNEDEFDKLTDEEKEVVVDLVTDDSALESLENHQVEIEAFARIFGVEKVDDLKAKLDGLTDKQIQVLTKVLGQIDVEKLKTTVAGLDDKTVQAIAKALGEGDVEGLKTTISGLDDKTVQAIAQALGYNDVSELNSAIDNLDPKTVQAIAQALGITDVDSLRNAINRLSDKDVEAAASVSGKDDVDSLKSSIDNLKGKTITVWASIKKKASNLWDKLTGGGGVDGTAHVDGTAFVNGTTSGRAFKQGSWGTKDSGVALGGELAPELLVRDGRWHLIGEKGAEFFGYKKGDIIFNGDQTKEIFEKGKITHGSGRGKALANGTAFAKGTVNKVTGQSYKISDSKSDSNDFEETFDWIEIWISRVERAIDRLDKKASHTWDTWGNRNKNLASEISKVNSEISIQQKAYDKYMSAANAVGLESKWKKKVQDGTINFSTIKDELTAEKVKSYQEYYEAALDAKDAVLELQNTEAELYAQRVENVATQYEGVLGVIEYEKNMLEEYISQTEANAMLVSANYYKALSDNEKENVAQLKKEKTSMLSELEVAMKSGTIEKYSESWYDMCNQIDEVTLAIEESNTQLQEYEQTLQQLSWEIFDLLQEKISSVSEEANFLIELLSSDKLYDDNGKLTDSGLATMGLHGQNYNTYMYQADQAGVEAERLRNELSKDPFDTELEERYREMISLQQEYILNAQDEKEAIRDMVEEGIEFELDALQELIDKKNEELESERDLYEYQKKVLEQTKEISSLEKQIASYSGDTSEEAKAKVQELKVSLEEAKANLEETEYDKYISDQNAMFDELYLEYETILNTRLDNIDALISDMIVEINSNASTINATISEKADSVGYTLSESMQTIWDNSSTSINSVITTYGEKFSLAQTTTNNALNVINTNLQNMITQLNKLAKTNVKSASTSSSTQSKEASAKKSTSTSSSTAKNKTSTTNSTTKTIAVGGKINAKGAKIYDYAGDKSGERQLYRNDPIYKVLKTDGNWLQVRWHKLSKGITGWFKKGDVKAYKTGAKNILDSQAAWTQENGREFIVRPSDGAILTPIAKGDSVLNANASSNIWNMANSPTDFIRDNLGLGNSNIPNDAKVNNNVTQHIDITQNFPNVKSYEETLTTMSKDPKFNKLINAMTTDRYVGKSSLAKGKVIR